MKRQLNQRAIQKLLEEDVGSKEEEWDAILGLKFNVLFESVKICTVLVLRMAHRK